MIDISSNPARRSSSPFGSRASEGILSRAGDPRRRGLEKLISIVSISSLVILEADMAFSRTHATILELRFEAQFSSPVSNWQP